MVLDRLVADICFLFLGLVLNRFVAGLSRTPPSPPSKLGWSGTTDRSAARMPHQPLTGHFLSSMTPFVLAISRSAEPFEMAPVTSGPFDPSDARCSADVGFSAVPALGRAMGAAAPLNQSMFVLTHATAESGLVCC